MLQKSVLKNYRFNMYDMDNLEYLKSKMPKRKEVDIVRMALKEKVEAEKKEDFFGVELKLTYNQGDKLRALLYIQLLSMKEYLKGLDGESFFNYQKQVESAQKLYDEIEICTTRTY